MKNNTLELVSFETAKKLKEIGFNYPCNYYYDETQVLKGARQSYPDRNFNGDNGLEVSAPQVQLVFQWLRNEKNIDCTVFVEDFEQRTYTFTIITPKNRKYIPAERIFDTYEEAQSQALQKALELA